MREIEIRADISVGTYDIDFGGVASNIVYIRWLEDLRVRALAEAYPIQRLVSEGLAPVVMTTYVEYKRPVRFLDRPVGTMRVSLDGPARLKFIGRIEIDGAVSLTSEQHCCIVDLTTGRPARLPAALREALSAG